MLFFGDAGCGKTSLARVVAQHLKTTSENIIEINAASNTGIDNIREIILENMDFPPFNDSKVVYIIDECHMLSNSAQNSLLKALEEPPEWVYFILCTTNIKKVIKTIQSRATKFEVLPLEDINDFAYLCDIVYCQEKGIDKSPLSDELINKLYESTGGKPRALLSELTRLVSLEEKDFDSFQTKSIDNDVNTSNLANMLLKGENWGKISDVLRSIENIDIEGVRRGILGYATVVLLKGMNNNAIKMLDNFKKPFYDSGKAGLVLACLKTIKE